MEMEFDEYFNRHYPYISQRVHLCDADAMHQKNLMHYAWNHAWEQGRLAGIGECQESTLKKHQE